MEIYLSIVSVFLACIHAQFYLYNRDFSLKPGSLIVKNHALLYQYIEMNILIIHGHFFLLLTLIVILAKHML